MTENKIVSWDVVELEFPEDQRRIATAVTNSKYFCELLAGDEEFKKPEHYDFILVTDLKKAIKKISLKARNQGAFEDCSCEEELLKELGLR